MAKQESYTQTISLDSNGDGILDNITRSYFRYENGNLVEVRNEYDHDANGIVDAIYTTQHDYDKRDRIVETRQHDDWDANGAPEYQYTEKFSYYKNTDTVLSSALGYDINGDGIFDSFYYVDNTVNKKGQVIQTLDAYDYAPADGVIDSRDVYNFKYGKEGDLIRATADYGNDGTINYEMVVERMAKQESYTQTFSSDSNGDGVFDYVVRSYFRYEKGNLVELRDEYDEDANGVVDAIYTTQHDYDKRDRIVETRQYDDWDANGAADRQYTEKFSYYKNTDTFLSRVLGYDINGDGIFDSFDYIDNTVNKKGQVIMAIYAFDYDPADGVIDRRDLYTSEYNKEGDLIRETADYRNDGTINYEMFIEGYAYPIS